MSETKTKEQILDECYEPKMHWKLVNRNKILGAMDEYAKQETAPFKKETKTANKEVSEIKAYISKARTEVLKNHGDNFALLQFIQKLEESFTWVRNT